MTDKKNNKRSWAIIIIAIIIFAILAMMDISGIFSFADSSDECVDTALIIDGVHIQTFDELREVKDVATSNNDFKSIGINSRNDGLYIIGCELETQK